MSLSPIQAAISALIADLGAVAVGFGVVNNTTVGVIESALVGAVSLAFVIVNEVRNHTLAAHPKA